MCFKHTKSYNPIKWLWLFPIIDRTFTSWPFGKFNAVDTIESTPSEEEYIIPWGVYKLYIKDGKKYLVL